MINPEFYDRHRLRTELKDLIELARNVRCSWNHSADSLWKMIDPELWELSHNSWLVVNSCSNQRLRELAADDAFRAEFSRQTETWQRYLTHATWFARTHADKHLGSFAYFSMEFGLSEALPIYAGGLGVLAGDLLKTASDLGVPIVGVGLLYQQGYFRQAIDKNDEQIAFYPYNAPAMMPVAPVLDANGEWVRVRIQLPGRTLHVRAWEVRVGRLTLYLLDTNDPLNVPGDRSITGELYGSVSETRFLQEIVLGVGGWQLLELLGLDVRVCHLNEGHAALAVLERARSFMERTGQPFRVALRCTRAGNVFTTHTSVEAAFYRFPASMLGPYAGGYARRLGITEAELLGLGRLNPQDPNEPFNPAYLAIRGSGRINAVSRLHGEVSRRIFQPLFPHWPPQEVPIGHVTNGVHMPSWDSAAADALWTQACGPKRWLGGLEELEGQFARISDEAIWAASSAGRRALIEFARGRVARQQAVLGAEQSLIDQCACAFDFNTLTIGFARRFTAYKRPNLLLADTRRLVRLLNNPERPVQLLVAGVAHPNDEEGRRMVRQWWRFVNRPEVRARAAFIEDYDLAVASHMVQGVDLWINTPRRPWEACGTSGMKVLVNGGLNLSELDGWWAEAYSPEVGWALGDGREHPGDPGWDRTEAEALYSLLEREVIPAFYERDERGIPRAWIARVRASMARLTPRFSSNRMVREYVEDYYLPAAQEYAARTARGGLGGAELEKWIDTVKTKWPQVRFGNVDVRQVDNQNLVRVQVYLGELDPDCVRVQLYAEPQDGVAPPVEPMQREAELAGTANSYVYVASVPVSRPASDYTARIIPYHRYAHLPLEADHLILWQR